MLLDSYGADGFVPSKRLLGTTIFLLVDHNNFPRCPDGLSGK